MISNEFRTGENRSTRRKAAFGWVKLKRNYNQTTVFSTIQTPFVDVNESCTISCASILWFCYSKYFQKMNSCRNHSFSAILYFYLCIPLCPCDKFVWHKYLSPFQNQQSLPPNFHPITYSLQQHLCELSKRRASITASN